ncbi:hypothetical protein WJX73_000592 [Symbiochloris irregularis]|uniref:BZIP domain-containing protein n=1 Tax=Symbiochloris irregularis TaxID=706552 RepID=A0AAW1NNT4_9CHLO
MATSISPPSPLTAMAGFFPDAPLTTEDDAKFLAFLSEPLPPLRADSADNMAEDFTLFSDNAGPQQQGIIPPFFQQETGEQQTATFSAHHFPSSYSSYLSKVPAVQSRQSDVASAAQSQGSGSSDAPKHNSQEAKQQRVREKNRRAMKKFREKQKEKSKASENRLQDLSSQLQSLQLENERLLSQNRTLKLASMCKDAMAECTGNSQTAVACTSDWEPRKGWSDFNPQSAMLLHLGPPGSPPVRITCQQMRAMTQPHMTELVRGYVMRAAPLLVEANDDLSSPAAAELQCLKYELNALAAHCAMNNPTLMHRKWGIPSAGSPAAPLQGPLPADQKQHALHLMRVLDFTPEQRATMVKVYQLVVADIRRLKQERLNILNHLQELNALEAGTPEPRQFSAILDGLKQLTLNTEDMHRCYCIHGASLWSTMMNCIQVAKIVIHSFPGAPNMWTLCTAAAELPADELVTNAELNNAVESRYAEIWKWHSAMSRQGRLGTIPTAACPHSVQQDLPQNLHHAPWSKALGEDAPAGTGQVPQLFRDEHDPPVIQMPKIPGQPGRISCDILAPQEDGP